MTLYSKYTRALSFFFFRIEGHVVETEKICVAQALGVGSENRKKKLFTGIKSKKDLMPVAQALGVGSENTWAKKTKQN